SSDVCSSDLFGATPVWRARDMTRGAGCTHGVGFSMSVLNKLDDRHDTGSYQPTKRSSFRTSMHKGNANRVDDVLKRLRFVTGAKSDRELSLRFGYSPTAMTNKRQRGSVPYDECVQVAEERG